MGSLVPLLICNRIPANGKAYSEVILSGNALNDIPPNININQSLPLSENLKEQAKVLIQVVDKSLTQLNSARSTFGATANQLESAFNIGNITYVQLKSAESIIRDVDYGEESTNLSKLKILANANTYAIVESSAKKMDDFYNSLFNN